ncbi:uncharacterized protein LOC111105038 [Crassostrea virginica]
MASECEIEVSVQDLVVDRKTFEEIDSQTQKKVQTLFLRTDIILEVEGRQIHVNRQMLADHSPVFQGMFESDFKEKHMDNIPLPDKKFEDFEIFLSSFYYNEFQHTITDDTVLVILPLAIEYQVTAVQDRCESFITKKLKQATNHEIERMDIPTLLSYIEYAEKYKLPTILALAVNLCARYDIPVLKEAGVEDRVSEKTWKEILEDRNSLMTTFMRKILQTGNAADVLATFDLITGLVVGNPEDTHGLIRTYENKLVVMLTNYPEQLTVETLVEIIITGECFKLENLLSSAVNLAFMCDSKLMKGSKRYHQISKDTKATIDEKRVVWLQENSYCCYVSLKD